MLRYLARRTPTLLLALFATSVVAFLLPRLIPGDTAVAMAGPDPSPEEVESIRQELGLDKPLILQYIQWMGGLLTGHPGNSFTVQRPVEVLLAARLESTLSLTIGAGILMITFGILLGVIAGTTRSKAIRTAVDGLSTILLASPSFLTGLILILVFGVYLRALPISGEVSFFDDPGEAIKYLILPSIALAAGPAAVIGRLLAVEMRRTRNEEFVDLAKSKGVRPTVIVWRHVLRNSLGPAIVAIGLRIADLLAGTVVIEAIFARNGIGQLAVSSVAQRDFPVVQVIIVIAVLIAVLSQYLTEIVQAAFDPRIRLSDR